MESCIYSTGICLHLYKHLNFTVVFKQLLYCRGGEIGRRAGFKIRYPSGCGGSIPFLGTAHKTPS